MDALRHTNIIDGVRYRGCLIKRDALHGTDSPTRHWCTIQVNEGKVSLVFPSHVVPRGENPIGFRGAAGDEADAHGFRRLQSRQPLSRRVSRSASHSPQSCQVYLPF